MLTNQTNVPYTYQYPINLTNTTNLTMQERQYWLNYITSNLDNLLPKHNQYTNSTALALEVEALAQEAFLQHALYNQQEKLQILSEWSNQVP